MTITGLVIGTVAGLLLILIALALARFRKFLRARAAKREQEAAQEAERLRAMGCAQERLNELYAAGKSLFGVEHTNLVKRVDAALGLLGHDDRATAEQMLLPAAYANLKDAANRYADIMDGRSVVDNIVTVHAHDCSTSGYVTDVYDDLAQEAQAITTLAVTLRSVQAYIREQCSAIEHTIGTVPQRCQKMEQDGVQLQSKIDEYATAGFVIRPLRRLLKTARIGLGKAKVAMGEKNYLTAEIHLETAQEWMENAQQHTAEFLDMEEKLEAQRGLIPGRIESALAGLARLDAQQRALAHRYSVAMVTGLREQLARTRSAADTLPEKLSCFQKNLADLDLYEARNALRVIEAVLSQINMAQEAVQARSDELADFALKYRETRREVVKALGSLWQRVATREGQTNYRRGRVRKLEAQLQEIHEYRRTKPETAYHALLRLKNDIEYCERQSRSAHEAATKQ